MTPTDAQTVRELPGERSASLIALTQGKFAIVDAADYEWLSRYRWRAMKAPSSYYVSRSLHAHEQKPGGLRSIPMHRMVMNPPPGFVVDHINHDGLDNRRCNLRVCTQHQNNLNKIFPKTHRTTSIYRGVCNDRGRWRAAIVFSRKFISLGSYGTEIEAAKAYDAGAKKYFGEFAVFNFPSP